MGAAPRILVLAGDAVAAAGSALAPSNSPPPPWPRAPRTP
jgi:hypothetical protein